jgi:diguanylate cyclase (GGDEF)-like protein
MLDAHWIPTLATAVVSAAVAAGLGWRYGQRRTGAEKTKGPSPDAENGHPAVPVVRRALLKAHLEKLDNRRTDASSGITVFYLGIDGLKFINRYYGHAAGDQVLVTVGQRLRALSRRLDGIAHIGGDEFVGFVTGPSDAQRDRDLAQALLDAMRQPHDLPDAQLTVSVSLGICSCPQYGPARKTLSYAQLAMCAAKAQEPGSYVFYSGQGDLRQVEALNIERHLRTAMANHEFHLVFQPKINVASGKVTAAEALIRWRNPQLGAVSPEVFIPMAERLGLINAIGEWVLDEACRQARIWRNHGLRMRVAVNLSVRQLLQPHLVQQIQAILEHHQIHPSLLTCEITESLAIENIKSSGKAMRRLLQAGVHLSIDDFGTGYANLSYLRDLPVQELKIDRSFVKELGTSAQANALVEAIVKMAHALGKRVVAEGVENERQLEALRRFDCDEVQGFFFSQPISADMLLDWAVSNSEDDREFSASLFQDTQLPGAALSSVR